MGKKKDSEIDKLEKRIKSYLEQKDIKEYRSLLSKMDKQDLSDKEKEKLIAHATNKERFNQRQEILEDLYKEKEYYESLPEHQRDPKRLTKLDAHIDNLVDEHIISKTAMQSQDKNTNILEEFNSYLEKRDVKQITRILEERPGIINNPLVNKSGEITLFSWAIVADKDGDIIEAIIDSPEFTVDHVTQRNNNNENTTALMDAVRCGKNEAAMDVLHILSIKLKEAKTDSKTIKKEITKFINQQDKSGNTALHYALGWFRPEVETSGLIEMLIKDGADVNIKNNNKQSPLHMLFNNNYSKEMIYSVVGKILQAGGDLEQKDKNHHTPIHDLNKAEKEEYKKLQKNIKKGNERF